MNDLLLRPIEAARAIKVGRSRIYQLIESGSIPSVRIGRSVRVPVRQLEEWVAAKVVQREHQFSEDNGM